MWTRSYWILMTYIKRPLFWFAAIALVIGSLVFWSMVDDRYETVQRSIVSRQAIRSMAQLNSVVTADAGRIVELDYQRLHAETTRQLFQRPPGAAIRVDEDKQQQIHAALAGVEQLERVVAVAAGYAVDQATIERMAKFTTLQRLSLFSDLGQETLRLDPLIHLNDLKELRLGHLDTIESLKPLAQLANLRRLSIDSALLIHRHGFDDIARLEHLEHLSLPDLQAYPVAFDGLSKLAECKHLKRIDYNMPGDQHEAFAAVQSQVPGIPVIPSRFFPARALALVFALWMAALISCVAMHLNGQFSLPAAGLAPHFRTAHHVIGGSIVAIAVLGLTAVLVSVGSRILAAGSLMLFYVAAYSWTGTWIPRTREGAWLAKATAIPIGLAPLLALGLRRYSPMTVEQYLLAGNPLLSALFLVAAVWLGWHCYRNLEVRLNQRMEMGVPALLSLRDVQKYGAAWRSRQSQPLTTHVYSRWTANLTAFGMLVLMGSLVAAVPWVGSVYLRRSAAMICTVACLGGIYVIGLKWWAEMPFFAASTTRPPSRSRHVDRLVRAIAVDFGKLTPVLLACLVSICTVDGYEPGRAAERLVPGIVMVVSVTLVLFAVVLWMLVIRSIVGVVLMAFVTYTICVPLMATMALSTLDRSGPLTRQVPVLAGVAVSAIAIVAIALVRRYYARVEWARFI